MLPDVCRNCLFSRTLLTALLLAAGLEERSRDDKHLLATVRSTAVINSSKVSRSRQILYKHGLNSSPHPILSTVEPLSNDHRYIKVTKNKSFYWFYLSPFSLGWPFNHQGLNCSILLESSKLIDKLWRIFSDGEDQLITRLLNSSSCDILSSVVTKCSSVFTHVASSHAKFIYIYNI